MNLECDPLSLQCAKFCNCSDQDCHCGERNVYEWGWDETEKSTTSKLSEHKLEVKFHPVYSSGTAVVRGSKLLERGRHHFWEIKMITPVYGTDVMIGVGTKNVDLNGARETFCSLLGRDKESWGFSYRGNIKHGGIARPYYPSYFGQGCLVGVHLDTWRGTLEFFVNRKPLGIAFTGLRDIDLYPMACSTAARSKMRITYSCSTPASLQMECLAVLRPTQRAYLSNAFPGLRYLSQSIFADMLQRHFDDDDEDDKLEFHSDYTIFDDYDFALVGCRRKQRKQKKRIQNNKSAEVVL